ncbi:hypothetical protein AVEN_197813-1 [Araneus ventricosus]|uniref:Uncharacterized protein n=1 Tax=Araneus ventricosus TaxID=182803 RepID=A0A4Y2NQI9_ARAVE|nr:hypothetical protein AVEN_197813-1 [Araneus ventricosus]
MTRSEDLGKGTLMLMPWGSRVPCPPPRPMSRISGTGPQQETMPVPYTSPSVRPHATRRSREATNRRGELMTICESF